MECKILESEKSDIIEREINSYLKRGWQMLGSLQAIPVRRSESHDSYYDQIIYTQVLLKE